MSSILICISFNIIMKLILIIGFLLPLICSDALFIFSKTVFLLLFFVIIIISYFLVRLNITLLRKYFLRYILTSLLFYSCYHGSYKTLSLVYCHLAHNSCTQSHGLYSPSTVSLNIFLLSLIVPLFADNKVFPEMYWPPYYFTVAIMEATKLFHWFIAILLTIRAHNHMVFILRALFLSTFFYYHWSFLYLLITTNYFIQFNMNYFIAIHYIIIFHRYYMFKYYWGLSLVSLN